MFVSSVIERMGKGLLMRDRRFLIDCKHKWVTGLLSFGHNANVCLLYFEMYTVYWFRLVGC